MTAIVFILSGEEEIAHLANRRNPQPNESLVCPRLLQDFDHFIRAQPLDVTEFPERFRVCIKHDDGWEPFDPVLLR